MTPQILHCLFISLPIHGITTDHPHLPLQHAGQRMMWCPETPQQAIHNGVLKILTAIHNPARALELIQQTEELISHQELEHSSHSNSPIPEQRQTPPPLMPTQDQSASHNHEDIPQHLVLCKWNQAPHTPLDGPPELSCMQPCHMNKLQTKQDRMTPDQATLHQLLESLPQDMQAINPNCQCQFYSFNPTKYAFFQL